MVPKISLIKVVPNQSEADILYSDLVSLHVVFR